MKGKGVNISASYYCPHHPEAVVDKYRQKCDCRKPGTGLFEKAISEFNIDLDNLILIGDKERDVVFRKKYQSVVIYSNEKHILNNISYIKGGLLEAAKLITGDTLVEVLKSGKKILVAGNGGSAADAQHFANFKKLTGRYVIGIHPGASKEIKKWKKFPELLLKLKDIPDIVFLFFSAVGDDTDVKPLIDWCNVNGVDYLHICGDISEYIKRMALCDVVICNDSSAAHFAAALGIEVHIMFGPVLSEFARPYSNAGVHVYENNHVGCRPCNQGESLYGNRCLEEISVDEVAEGIISCIHT